MSLKKARPIPYVLLILHFFFLASPFTVECRFENSVAIPGLKFRTNEEMKAGGTIEEVTAGGSNSTEDQNLSIGSRRMLKRNGIRGKPQTHRKYCGFVSRLDVPNLYDPEAAASASKIWPYKWSPQPHRFLVLHCETGRISNRVFCILNALKFASILNRTLLGTLNRGEINHAFPRHFVFDVNHVRKCYGDNAFMSFQEYSKTYGHNVIIDQVLCMNKMGCPIQDFSAPIEQYFHRWGSVSFSKTGPKPQILENPKCEVTIEELKELYGNATGDVLYMGKFFYNQLVTENMFDVPILRSGKCHSNIGVQPAPYVLRSANGFVEEYFEGRNFMAIHLRRDDFKEVCEQYKDPKCYLPIEEVVACLKSKIQSSNLSDIFLATNSNPEEYAYISKNIRPIGFREVRLVRLKIGQWEDRKWAIPLHHPNHIIRDVFEAALEKAICTKSTVFAGSWRSTFSGDIERLRYGFGTSDPRDSYLCEDKTS